MNFLFKSVLLILHLILLISCSKNIRTPDNCEKTSCPKDGILIEEVSENYLLINFSLLNELSNLDFGFNLNSKSDIFIILESQEKIEIFGGKTNEYSSEYLFILPKEVTYDKIQAINFNFHGYKNLNLNYDTIQKTLYQIDQTSFVFNQIRSNKDLIITNFGIISTLLAIFKIEKASACSCNIEKTMYRFKNLGQRFQIHLDPL